MATYHRPNLTTEEQQLMADLLAAQLATLTLGSPTFDSLYRLYIKVRDAKPISTSTKTKVS
jgi:hypothetical protein